MDFWSVGRHTCLILVLGPGAGPWHECTSNRFQRIFVCVATALNAAFGVGIGFSAVDACFSKHAIYRDGFLHVLTTRDGNNRVLPIAWAICETESGDTYDWFADQCYAAGCGRYLNRAHSVVYSDRMKGIEQFFPRFRAYHGYCFKHIIENCRRHTKGCGRKFQDQTAWRMLNANSRRGFLHYLGIIRAQSPMAADYFQTKVNHAHTYQYMLNRNMVATHGFKTSQIVECINGVFVEARHFTPYHLNNKLCAWMATQMEKRFEESTAWLRKGKMLTPWARHLLTIEVRSWAWFYIVRVRVAWGYGHYICMYYIPLLCRLSSPSAQVWKSRPRAPGRCTM